METDPAIGVSAGVTESSDGDDRPVVVPVFGTASERTASVGIAVAAATGSELLVLDAAERSRDEASETTATDAETTHALPAPVNAGSVPVREAAVDGERSVEAIQRAVTRSTAGLLVIDEREPNSPADAVRGSAARRVSRAVDCDSVVVSDNRDPPSVASILVPVARGEHSARAVAAAGHLASATGAWVELLHVETGDGADSQALLDRMAEHVPDDVETERWIRDADDVADVIVEQSAYYDLTVIGAPRSSRLRRLVFGSPSDEIRDRAENTVLTVRRGERSLFEA